MANRPKHFKATLERGLEGMGWTVVPLPFDPRSVWTQMLRLRVRGEVLSGNGARVAFRTSLFPYKGEKGAYLLLVNNRVQREAGICAGSLAEFFLEPDLSLARLNFRTNWPRCWAMSLGCGSTMTASANRCGVRLASGLPESRAMPRS